MKILPGVKARNFKEAVDLALGDTGVSGISADAISLITSIIDAGKLRNDTEKAIGNTVRNRYRGKPSWTGKWWHVPIPTLNYDTKDVPHLTIEVRMHLVAVMDVETRNDYFTITLVGALGQPELLVIPMVFLHALLAGDTGRFGVLARSNSHTTWDVPGMKPVQLPNDFVNRLAETLRRQPVVDWLDSFGAQGRSVAPLVAGNLLGLIFGGSAPPIQAGNQSWTIEKLVSILEGMAYTVKEAKETVNRAAPYLRADHTLEEATHIVLQQAGKGG
jgi:hypothetical protein